MFFTLAFALTVVQYPKEVYQYLKATPQQLAELQLDGKHLALRPGTAIKATYYQKIAGKSQPRIWHIQGTVVLSLPERLHLLAPAGVIPLHTDCLRQVAVQGPDGWEVIQRRLVRDPFSTDWDQDTALSRPPRALTRNHTHLMEGEDMV
ncbi:hypothetical protein RhiJN_21066 [Ceratobasidium sp. AG-Ba]|nr:hypothetical protein RhiJN_21066 [Ceratobasidium sp. AG-Ba]